MAANPPPHQQQNGTNQAQTGLGSRVSQRQFFEQAWGAHEPNRHPEALRLHVERRERDAKVTDLAEFRVKAVEALEVSDHASSRAPMS